MREASIQLSDRDPVSSPGCAGSFGVSESDSATCSPVIALAAMTGLAIALDPAVGHEAKIRAILKP